MGETQFRSKIYWLTFCFSLMVVWVHSYNWELFLGQTLEGNAVALVERIFGESLGQMAVPGFFLVSGYLFFRTFALKGLLGKWGSRVRTVALPYVLWNLLYYAGYLKTVEGSTNPEAYAEGADYLNKALEEGYADEDGNIYYYLFHCYYGQKAKDAAFVMKSKDALLEGIEKFPKSERILYGLMQLYTAEKGVGDPADLVTMIDAAIAENPTNTDLWFGRGRIFYALKNYDESIKSFEKIVELKPDMYEGNYYLGLFYALKGDAMNKEMNERQYSSQADYDADLKTVNAVYMAAVPWFEKVLELKPNDPDAVEFLKSLCFRLRDEEGMMDKYKKYNDLYNQIKGN